MQSQRAFHSWAVRIQVFVEVNFGNTVVIQADGLADGVLRNFEPTIQVSAQSGFEIKSKREA